MLTFLVKLFIKPGISKEAERTAYGMLCGVLGIFLNVCLFAGKLVAGIISGAVSIMADAFNNLSDAGSSLVTMLGFKLAAQKPDRDHPYGHGRIEYISGFIVSMLILLMGFELIKESIAKIMDPEAVELSPVIIIILAASILVKCYMALYNFSAGKKIDSASLKATAFDSFSDCFATAIVLVSSIIGHFTGLKLDGWTGCLVSLFILYAGYSAAKESLNPLLGMPPEEAFVKDLEKLVLTFDPQVILGMHDLSVHDYGPGRRIISLHAEVPAEGDILHIHDVIDNLEVRIGEALDCMATIHMDPIVTNDPRVTELRIRTAETVKKIDERLTIHDFRVVFGDTHVNVVFDMVAPFTVPMSNDYLLKEARRIVHLNLGPNYYPVIKVDRENLIN